MVPLMNYSEVIYTVRRHERIAQLVAITTSDKTLLIQSSNLVEIIR